MPSTDTTATSRQEYRRGAYADLPTHELLKGKEKWPCEPVKTCWEAACAIVGLRPRR